MQHCMFCLIKVGVGGSPSDKEAASKSPIALLIQSQASSFGPPRGGGEVSLWSLPLALRHFLHREQYPTRKVPLNTGILRWQFGQTWDNACRCVGQTEEGLGAQAKGS